MCAFGMDPYTLAIVSADGSFMTAKFSEPGEMVSESGTYVSRTPVLFVHVYCDYPNLFSLTPSFSLPHNSNTGKNRLCKIHSRIG